MAMKNLTAKYPGKCGKCHGAFPAGTAILWGDGKTEHASCPAPLLASVPGGTGVAHRGSGQKTNRKAGSCESCGTYLAVGKGELVYCVEDSGCHRHHDEGGWHVYCIDKAACKACREQLVEAHKAEKAAREAKAAAEKAKAAEGTAAYNTLRDTRTAGLVHLSMAPALKESDWTVIASMRDGGVNRTLSEGTFEGQAVYREYIAAYDDWRTYSYVPAALAKTMCLDYAKANGIDFVKATEWLAKYSGCHGAEIYRFVVEASA